jgi:hypothetical protein
MSNVVQFAQAIASRTVVNKLIKLGYLKGTKRLNNRAIRDALAKLQYDLCLNQTIRVRDQRKADNVDRVTSR